MKMFQRFSEPSNKVQTLRTKRRETLKHPLDARERKLLLPFVPESLDQSLGIRLAKKKLIMKSVRANRIIIHLICRTQIIIGVDGINNTRQICSYCFSLTTWKQMIQLQLQRRQVRGLRVLVVVASLISRKAAQACLPYKVHYHLIKAEATDVVDVTVIITPTVNVQKMILHSTKRNKRNEEFIRDRRRLIKAQNT